MDPHPFPRVANTRLHTPASISTGKRPLTSLNVSHPSPPPPRPSRVFFACGLSAIWHFLIHALPGPARALLLAPLLIGASWDGGVDVYSFEQVQRHRFHQRIFVVSCPPIAITTPRPVGKRAQGRTTSYRLCLNQTTHPSTSPHNHTYNVHTLSPTVCARVAKRLVACRTH